MHEHETDYKHWREVNSGAHGFYKLVTRGKQIPTFTDPDGFATFEDAARYRLACLAAWLLVDLVDDVLATDDERHLSELAEAIRSDERVPAAARGDLLAIFNAAAPPAVDIILAARAATKEGNPDD